MIISMSITTINCILIGSQARVNPLKLRGILLVEQLVVFNKWLNKLLHVEAPLLVTCSGLSTSTSKFLSHHCSSFNYHTCLNGADIVLAFSLIFLDFGEQSCVFSWTTFANLQMTTQTCQRSYDTNRPNGGGIIKYGKAAH